jgi:hypothetical protein
MLRSHKPYNPTCHAFDTIGYPSMSKSAQQGGFIMVQELLNIGSILSLKVQ